MRWETYNFTPDFQDAIFACLIRHPKEFYAFGEIVKPAFFTGPAASELMFRYQEYRKKYGSYPTFTTLGNFAFHKASVVNVDHAKETLDYVEKLSKIDTSERQAIIDLSLKFAKERAVYDAIRKIHAAQTEGKMEGVDPVKVMQEAVAVGTNYDNLGVSLYHDIPEFVRKSMTRDSGVMPGYSQFEKLWQTGWGPGWLVVLLAPPKRYKTAFAINLALNIVKSQDADVLYYACEISQELAAMRALYNLTGWTQENFIEYPEKGIIAAQKAVKRDLWGNIFFKGYPSKAATISEIKSHAHQVIDLYNLNPKAVVIDYAETVRPDKVDKDMPDWRQQADIYTQARALGNELGCAVIMPDRCNKETVGKKVPSMKSFQGSFEKAGIVDAAIGLCATEDEYKHDRVRYFVFLNRHGQAFKHYDGTVDPQRMRMTVGQEIDYTPDDEDDKPQRRSFIKRRMASGAEKTQGD